MAAPATNPIDALERVLAAFQAKDDGTNKWRGACPVCYDTTGLIISKGTKGPPAAAFCKHECDQSTINTAIARAAGTSAGPATLAKFCELKKLPLAWVEENFLVHDGVYTSDRIGKDMPALGFPYLGQAQVTADAAGTHYHRPSGGTKYRFSLYKNAKGKRPEAWSHDYKPMLYGLWLPDYYAEEGIDTSVVVLCEGESDTITLVYNGIAALGISGAPNGWKADYVDVPLLANAKRILVVQEPDGAGAKLVARVAASFAPGKVCALTLPTKDPSDMWVNNKAEEFAARWAQAVAAALPVVQPAPSDYIVTRMSDIVPKPVLWLWPGRIPQSKITIFGGNPGVGKGLATCSLAAIATTGRTFPDEVFSDRDPMEVAIMFCEDDAEDTVVPRLMAAEADLSRVLRVQAPAIIGTGPNATRHDRELALDSDLGILRKALCDNPAVKLVIVDPISSYLGKIKPNDETQLRSVLLPIRDLAQDTGVTFVLIAHFNKRSDVNALHKVLGAVAMTGVARAAWLFAEEADREDGEEGHYLMLQGKMNVGRKMKGLEYTIGEKQIFPPTSDSDGKVGYIVWGDATDKTADKALGSMGAFGDAEGSKMKQAGQWLEKQLGSDTKLAREVFAAAEAAGISERTLKNAKRELGVVTSKMAGAWLWRLPAPATGDPEEDLL